MKVISESKIENRLKEIVLKRQDIYRGNLILVNRQNPLMEVQLENNSYMAPVAAAYPDILLKKAAANMLKQLMKVCSAENRVVPVSGYRSLKEQQEIFLDSLRENGEEFTFKFVALPNHSEHQTGLAIDVAENTGNIDFICPSFPYEGICQIFREKACNYGFIERYQKGKEGITGISHEPWHFRYVGYPHSVMIKQNALSLEEYIEYLKDFTYRGKHLFFKNQDLSIEIFYVEASKDFIEILVEENIPYQISGNNIDGFIITVWRKSQ